jgi:hypothetical protein
MARWVRGGRVKGMDRVTERKEDRSRVRVVAEREKRDNRERDFNETGQKIKERDNGI